jgi:hypothetical protein
MCQMKKLSISGVYRFSVICLTASFLAAEMIPVVTVHKSRHACTYVVLGCMFNVRTAILKCPSIHSFHPVRYAFLTYLQLENIAR